MSKMTLSVCLTLLILAGFARAGENEANAVSRSIIGQRYYLVNVDGEEFVGERHPYIEFESDLVFHGQVCNIFRGRGTLADGVFVSGPILSTRMLCGDAALSRIETRLFAMLERGTKLTREEGALILADDGGRLTFVSSASRPTAMDDLVGRKFLLRRMNGEEFLPANGKVPFMEFGREPGLTGIICNNFMASVEIADGRLMAKNAASTMMLCLDEKLDALETAFHAMLRDGADIVLDGSTLTLKNGDTTLVFEEE